VAAGVDVPPVAVLAVSAAVALGAAALAAFAGAALAASAAEPVLKCVFSGCYDNTNQIPTMNNRCIGLFALAAATAVAAILLTGCGTTAGYKRADRTGAGITGFREEVIKASADVNVTANALDEGAASKSLCAKTQAEGLEVQKSISALVAGLNTLAATITPTSVKAK
jgi:hypothetical protein